VEAFGCEEKLRRDHTLAVSRVSDICEDMKQSRNSTKRNIFMKRFNLTVAVLLPLCFFAGCKPSENPGASASPANPAPSGSMITASPNPVPAGEEPGITTITWNTGDGTMGQVYVSADGAEESVFAGAPQGSSTANWIVAGSSYRFRLYKGTEREKLLAETTVTRQK
jgi:hypothetical protein